MLPILPPPVGRSSYRPPAGAQTPRAAAAMAELCRIYWYPLYAFIRRRGHDVHEAEDLTQEFFARLLDKHFLAAADREKGRFRTFLLMAVKRFLANEHDRTQARKRGGGQRIVPLEGLEPEARYHQEPADTLDARAALRAAMGPDALGPGAGPTPGRNDRRRQGRAV